MNNSNRKHLSSYVKINTLSEEHGIYLVKHRVTNEIFVRKDLEVYNARVYRQLKEHPVSHTPHIYELCEENNILTVIEEFIPGDSLETLLETQGPLPADKVFHYMCALCDILTNLHTMVPPVIHRDIKPSNIIITPEDQPVLLDFNAARNYTSTKREDTELLGTRGYAAPEQYGFGESSSRTDLYAVGSLMKTLFTGSEESEMTVPGRAGEIIATCMKMDPSERYPSAVKLKAELQKAAKDDPEKQHLWQTTWRRYLPPGFRSGKPGHMICMSILYVFLISMACTLDLPNCPPGFIGFERACILAAFLLMVFFSANYAGIQGRLRHIPRRYQLLRIVLIILIDFSVFCFAAAFAVLVELILS